MSKPSFLITIDTEGDNLWSLPAQITTRNAAFLSRFQQLCEKYLLKPTWLTNWEMAGSAEFQEFATDVLRRGTGEVGMHLHAWNNPPLSREEELHPRRQLCLIESSPQFMHDKIKRLTDALESAFGVKMISHRAGRWGMNTTYARQLIEFGYLVDCSVTPHIRWQYKYDDAPTTECDYREFPNDAYWLNPEDLGLAGDSPLLEVPMTIFPGSNNAFSTALHAVLGGIPNGRRIANRICPQHHWFRPFRGNVSTFSRILDWVDRERRDYAEFMIHSSELMPGGSPSYPTEASIDRLYDRLEALFESVRDRFVGRTLAEYRAEFAAHAKNQQQAEPQTQTGRGS